MNIYNLYYKKNTSKKWILYGIGNDFLIDKWIENITLKTNFSYMVQLRKKIIFKKSFTY